MQWNSVLGIWLFIVQVISVQDFTKCAKDRSRIVRRRVQKELFPLYIKAGVDIPYKCLFSRDRDLFYNHELSKFEESQTKWVCQQCGKAFYEQRFIDNHLNNRHSDLVRKETDSVCLADLCDIFRCDVILYKNDPKYWEKILCKEKELKLYMENCFKLVKSCVPDSLTGIENRLLFEKLNRTLCSYLTCDDYWKLPDAELHPISLAFYIVATSLLLFGLLFYYYIVYTHFYTDDSLLVEKDKPRYQDNPLQYYMPPQGQDMRYRSGVNSRYN